MEYNIKNEDYVVKDENDDIKKVKMALTAFQNTLKERYKLDPEDARRMSEKILMDSNDTGNIYDGLRNGLYMTDPKKYSKMLRRKKSSKITTRKPKKNCICKKKK